MPGLVSEPCVGLFGAELSDKDVIDYLNSLRVNVCLVACKVYVEADSARMLGGHYSTNLYVVYDPISMCLWSSLDLDSFRIRQVQILLTVYSEVVL